MQRDFISQNNENTIYCLCVIKKGNPFLFLSFILSLTLLWFIKNVLVYFQLILEQISQTMVRRIHLKVYTDSYAYLIIIIVIIIINSKPSLFMV
jgi:hypothetical protein